MRLALPLIVTLAVAVAAPAAAAKPRCSLPSKATVLAASDYALAYSVGSGPRKYRACIRRTGRRLLLREDSFDDDPAVHRMSIAGRYAGWVEVLHDRWGQTTGGVSVYDLKRGRMRWRGGGPFRPVGHAVEVTDFALGANGRVAYVTLEQRPEYPDPGGAPSPWRTVWARDASGTRTLDEGRDAIGLTSLDLDGFTATWSSGGQRRSAQLY